MPEPLRLAADEHIRRGVVEGLRRLAVDIVTFQEAGIAAKQDLEQLAWAFTEGRIVLTHDRDYLLLNAAGVAHAGIFYCRATKYSIGEMVRAVLANTEMFPEALSGAVVFI